MPDIRLDRRAAQRLVNYLVRQQAEVAELGALIESLVQAPPADPVAPMVPQPRPEKPPDAAPP
jgi:hypothetical protein